MACGTLTHVGRARAPCAAGMEIKMLTPRDEESRRLVDWIEGGVYEAVKRGYLKTLLFGISSNAEGTDLLEVPACPS